MILTTYQFLLTRWAQGAVLDQLAGDVHTLERKAVLVGAQTLSPPSPSDHNPGPSSNGGAQPPTPNRKSSDDGGAQPSTPERLTHSSKEEALALVRSPSTAERGEATRLRSELKEAREVAGSLRAQVAAARKA